jgi:predicted CoA-binding protein
MSRSEQIDRFLDGAPHAVVGASRDRDKYGNKVLRAYAQAKRPVVAVNPSAQLVEGQVSYPDLGSIPHQIHGISIITPPHITEDIVEQAGGLGIGHVWMQPGSESEKAIRRAEELGMNVIAGGACALVVLGFRER